METCNILFLLFRSIIFPDTVPLYLAIYPPPHRIHISPIIFLPCCTHIIRITEKMRMFLYYYKQDKKRKCF